MNTHKTIMEKSTYQRQLHTFGRVTNIIAVLSLLAVPVILQLATGIRVDWRATGNALVGILSLMGILAVVEFATYAPMLGAGATYLTFITGNTVNMKLPSAMSSVKIAEVDMNSPEGEIVSTMAVAVSSLVTIFILLVGLIGLSFILPILQSPGLKPAFDNLMPALMGAMATPVLFRDLKISAVPVALAAVLTLVLGYTVFTMYQGMLMPFFLLITILWRYLFYRRELKLQRT
jgi:hypothetical protein